MERGLRGKGRRKENEGELRRKGRKTKKGTRKMKRG